MKKKLLIILQSVLRSLAHLTLWRYRPMIIGITGNVGKTSTKEAIKLVLAQERRIRVPAKSFNNEFGLPLTILGNWDLRSSPLFWFKVFFISLIQIFIKNPYYPEVLILEYGVDKPGDMSYLLNIARPHIGVVTALGDIPVHIEKFPSRENLINEKSKLINNLPATGFAILNADDPEVLTMQEHTRAKVITFGFADSANVQVTNFSNQFDGTSLNLILKLNYGGSFVPLKLENVLGRPQAYAVVAAATVGLLFGLNLVKIAEALAHYQTAPGRFRILQGVKDTTIIDDTYNSSPTALREAIETLKNLSAKRKIVVLGDMLELGKYTIEAHEAIGKMAAQNVDLIITLGTRAKFIAEAASAAGFSKDSVFAFDNLTEASKFLEQILQKGDLVLIKGSQSVRMEKIVKEVMAEPEKANELLVRQNKEWLQKSGLYDAPIV